MQANTLIPSKRKIVFSVLLSIIFTTMTILTILIDIIPQDISLSYLPLSSFLTLSTVCFYIDAPIAYLIFFSIHLLIPIILNCCVGFSFKKPKIIRVAYIICIIEIIHSLMMRNIIPLTCNLVLLIFVRLTVDYKKEELPRFTGQIKNI